jgi:uncharacterized protein
MVSAAAERLISVDSHVHFTDDWIKARLSSKLQATWDEAVKKRAHYEATVLRGGQPNLQMEDFVDLEAARDPGHFDPRGKLAAMDRDGVEAEVIFPEVDGAKLCTPTLMGDDWKAGLEGYNQAMADFASIDNKRLLTAYQIPLFDIDFAVKEVKRLAKLGARCVQIHPFPAELGLPDVHDPRYNPLWSEISESGIALLNHLDIKQDMWEVFRRDPSPQKGIMTAMPWASMRETIMFWILTGTIERFPKLNVILIEPGLGWLPSFFEMLDQRMDQHYTFPGVKRKPSETFRAQMGASFMYEPTGLAECYKVFGADCLYWSTDFPHPATCWPNSQKQVKSQFAEAGIPDADRKKIICDNGLKLFGL